MVFKIAIKIALNSVLQLGSINTLVYITMIHHLKNMETNKMKKVILFLWFGDEKPPYIQWTIENFRKMNPGWEIRYIEYSNEQILNYKEQNDQILVSSVEENKRNHVNYIADKYRWKYLEHNKNEMIVYCDLDCFPIAPFDNFILPTDVKLFPWQQWIRDNHQNKHTTKLMGTNWFRLQKY